MEQRELNLNLNAKREVNKEEINKFKKRYGKGGILTKLKIQDLLVDLATKSEIPWHQFTTTPEVDLKVTKDGVEEIKIAMMSGVIIREEDLKMDNKGFTVFPLMCIDDPDDPGKIMPFQEYEVRMSFNRILKIDAGEITDGVTFLELQIVEMLNTTYCLARINSLNRRYFNAINKLF